MRFRRFVIQEIPLVRSFVLRLAVLAFIGVATATQAAAPKPARPALATTVAFDEAGRLWRVRLVDGRLIVDSSADGGQIFAGAVPVTAEPEAVAADGELRPEIAFGGNGNIYVAWTSPLAVPFAGHIRFTRSTDGGRTFEMPMTVNDNREAITHRFQSMHVAPDGRITLAWIDKRELEAAKRSGGTYRGAAIYYAVSEDGGRSFGANGRLAAHSCECCRIALAGDTDGRPVALWRHVFADGTRDHALARVVDAAIEPQRATTERWKVNACPHHGPDLAIAADGTRHGVWFNQAEDGPGVFYGAWNREGQARRAAMRVGPQNAAHPALLLVGDQILIAWKAFNGDRTVVSAMRSSDGGLSWSPVQDVATTEGASDHPRLVSSGDRAYLSWSAAQEGHRLLPLGEEKTR